MSSASLSFKHYCSTQPDSSNRAWKVLGIPDLLCSYAMTGTRRDGFSPEKRILVLPQSFASRVGYPSSDLFRIRSRLDSDDASAFYPIRARHLLDEPAQALESLRPTTDYGTSMVQWMRRRRYGKTFIEQERPSPSYMIDMLPPPARVDRPADTVPAKHMHSSLNKIKHPINVVKWTPEGRRLLTGSSSGEFTLWNGMGFNFETIMSAHDTAIRAVAWAHSDDWLISCDQNGIVKYWQPNFNNVKEIQAHENSVRDLAFSPTDTKYVTASDDSSIKLWDFSSGKEESTFTGHGWDVRSIDWHPSKGLVVSGSRDHLVKLWDPRTGRCLTNLHGHKNTVSKTKFDPIRGQLLATCARDSTARVFDLRMMRDVLLLKGHEKDIMTLTWHPIHHSLLSTAGSDGSIHHYLLDEPNPPDGVVTTKSPYDSPDPTSAPAQTIYPAHKIPFAHESPVWSLDWHPLGHILASGSNDRVTRFWSRVRPGETECFHDRYHLGDAAAKAHGSWTSKLSRHNQQRDEDEEEEDDAEALIDQKMPARQLVVPGLPGINIPQQDGSSTGGAQPMLPGTNMPAPALAVAAALQQQQPLVNPLPQPPQIPGMPPVVPQPLPFDLSKLNDPAELQWAFGGRPPPFPLPGQNPGQFPPPPPGFSFQNGLPPVPPPPGYPGSQQPAHAFPPVPMNGAYSPAPAQNPPYGGVAAQDASTNTGRRRRAPLPSQQESLKEEQRRGNYQRAR